MSKQWKCGDCCCFGTDACHYPSMLEEYVACEHLVTDPDKAYQQGRIDALDEFISICEDAYPNNYINDEDFSGRINYFSLFDVRCIAEQIKEQKDE